MERGAAGRVCPSTEPRRRSPGESDHRAAQCRAVAARVDTGAPAARVSAPSVCACSVPGQDR